MVTLVGVMDQRSRHSSGKNPIKGQTNDQKVVGGCNASLNILEARALIKINNTSLQATTGLVASSSSSNLKSRHYDSNSSKQSAIVQLATQNELVEAQIIRKAQTLKHDRLAKQDARITGVGSTTFANE